MEYPSSNISVRLTAASQKRKGKLAEYYRLSLCGELSDEDAERLEQIYEEAKFDPCLNFLIEEVDYFINRRLGLLDESSHLDYENQKSWLREHLQEVPLDEAARKAMQKLLQEFNYYKGPIDGVIGSRSTEAIQQFHQDAQRTLAERGFYHHEIDGIFGIDSITAVKQFQKTEKLKEDGVLGRETSVKLLTSRG
ncbi:MAG: peptidoglycan-binding domain-containing protein [Cyanobacteria bacterium P01_C01_bin.121]